MEPLKAIETRYKGFRFRSRLEARYAVLFDDLDIKWEYEKEGFNLPSGRYLPDFWLPVDRWWVEIKGEEPSKEEMQLCRELRAALEPTARGVIILSGSPYPNEFAGRVYPQSPARQMPPYTQRRNEDVFVINQFRACADCATGLWMVAIGSSFCTTLKQHSTDCYWTRHGEECYELRSPLIDGDLNFVVENAFKKARGARFEHGEEG